MLLKHFLRRKNPPHHRRARPDSAQALPYFILMMFALVGAWAAIINIAKLLQERMMMQNAADNAALAVAQYQARVLNTIGYLNNSIGRALAAGAYPALTPIALYNQQYVGHPADAICKMPPTFLGIGFESREESRHVAALASLVKTYSEAQKKLIDMYPVVSQLLANEIAARQQYDSEGNKTGARLAVVLPLKISGLKKNDLKIKYYKTKVYEVSWPPGKHAHVFLPEEYRTDDVSWYYIDNENHFAANRKITVTVVKSAPKGYPAFGKLLGIRFTNPWFGTMAVASAAAYNPRGPSFPLEKNNSTGMSIRTIPIAVTQLNESLQEMSRLAGEVGSIPIIGGALAGIAGTLAATVSAIAAVSVTYAMTSPDTPIKRYDESANPENNLTGTALEYGWEAHLVPVDGPFVH
ncbi:MAG: hypothetical protein CVU77_03845 [Elusimicrobia bacterium HGW-Elusimicrobia-1]|jgi:hypothetical protein|nr:MAG: hypothetical protein CVU77_03845 [Elusimicrobia bacterium HGW-Elusimicrobia-1]